MIEISTFFLIGLTGGFGHCVLMCNPFVIFISSKYAVSGTGYSMLIPHIYYNFGRIITYTVLGAIAGFFGGVVQYAGSFANIQKLSAIIGGVILILFALFSFLNMSSFMPLKLNIMKYFRRFEPASPLLTGIFLGLLPCGLSMGAVIGAATSGSLATGAFLMVAFGVGTSIAMFILAIFGNLAMKYSKIFRKIGGILLLLMGAYFIRMGIIF